MCLGSNCYWTYNVQQDGTFELVVAYAHPDWLQGSLTAALPASADVDTQGWLQSGMTVQLLQVCTLPVTPAGGTAGLVACEGSTKSSERCIARGVLQPDALLEGVTREWSSRLSLLKEPPLFDAQGIRLGVHLGATGNDEVCALTCYMAMAQ